MGGRTGNGGRGWGWCDGGRDVSAGFARPPNRLAHPGRGCVGGGACGLGLIVGLFVIGFFIVFEFDLVVEVAGIGCVEDGDGAAAFFGGVFCFAHGIDKFAECFEAGVGEFVGVWRHGDPPGEGVDGGRGKMRPSTQGPRYRFARAKPHRFGGEICVSACQDWAEKI